MKLMEQGMKIKQENAAMEREVGLEDLNERRLAREGLQGMMERPQIFVENMMQQQ